MSTCGYKGTALLARSATCVRSIPCMYHALITTSSSVCSVLLNLQEASTLVYTARTPAIRARLSGTC